MMARLIPEEKRAMRERILSCGDGSHDYRLVHVDKDSISELVVRHCKVCGCIVVDEDYDGRTKPGQFFPLTGHSLYFDLPRALDGIDALEAELAEAWEEAREAGAEVGISGTNLASLICGIADAYARQLAEAQAEIVAASPPHHRH